MLSNKNNLTNAIIKIRKGLLHTKLHVFTNTDYPQTHAWASSAYTQGQEKKKLHKKYLSYTATVESVIEHTQLDY